MRVTQTISIGTLRINSMSNTSILQIGATGGMKSRSESISEYVTPTQANKKLEGKITKEAKKVMPKQGLPVEKENEGASSPGTASQGAAKQAGEGTGAGAGYPPYPPGAAPMQGVPPTMNPAMPFPPLPYSPPGAADLQKNRT